MKINRILSAFLACVMLLGAFVITGTGIAAQNPDISMPMASPVIDGVIEESGAWSQAAALDESHASNFWNPTEMSATAKLYFAYDEAGLYFAADIDDDDDFVYSTGYDNIDDDYGFNGDVMTLMLDTLGLFEKTEPQINTPWYNFGIFEDGSIKCYRSMANDGDITDDVNVMGRRTDDGWCFEAYIRWEDIAADTNAAGGFEIDVAAIAAKDAVSRGAAMYMDRYWKVSTPDTWGRYITVCDTTYDGDAGNITSGTTPRSFGLVLVNGDAPEHIWGDWTVTKEATCSLEGSRSRTCTDCGITAEETISKLDHVFGEWKDVTVALRERRCENCDYVEQDNTAPDSDQLIVAYFNASVAINAYEFHNIDVINYHPAHINIGAPGNGSEGNIIIHTQTGKLDMYRDIACAQNPDIKFVFTVANNNLQVFESWFSTKPMAEKLAGEVTDIVRTYDYDGFDIDYEFPTGAPNTRQNFVYFMQVMKEKFAELGKETGKEYILSMAVPGTQWTFDLFDMNALAEHVSYFNMMNYDLYIGENGRYTPHHHTPAYDNYNGFAGGSVYGDIQLYLERGIPADKIVAGCGLYAHRWTGVEDGGTHGLYQSGSLDYSNVHYTQIKYSFVNKGGYKRYWDEKAGAPYLYNATQKVFISYDDEQSVELKCKIVAEEGIRGIMVFDYCTTDGIGLFDSMRVWLNEYTPEYDILNQFKDVNKNAWYADAVRYCVSMGYASGMNSTTFAPNATLTRAQFVQLLAGIDGVDLSQYSETNSTFTDVKMGTWFHNAVTWAVRNNYVAGMSADSFKPNNNLTREQLVRILYNYAADNGRDMEGRADLTVFADHSKVSDWAYEEMSWAVNEGIISGMSATTVGPRGTATRAQAMQIIMTYDKKSS